MACFRDGSGRACKFHLDGNGTVLVSNVLVFFEAVQVQFKDAEGILCVLESDDNGRSLDRFENGATVDIQIVKASTGQPITSAHHSRIVRSVPEELVPFWRDLDKASPIVEAYEINADLVTKAVTVISEHSLEEVNIGIRVYKRRKVTPRVMVKATMLSLKTPFPLMKDVPRFLVRDVYDKFVEAAFEILQGKRACGNEKVRHLFITGSPGTGKTVEGVYILYKLRVHNLFKDFVMIWEEGSTKTSYYFHRDEVWHGKVGDFDFMVTENTIFLVNGPDPDLRMEQNIGHVIMFCSREDESDSCWQFFKDTMVYTMYMPTWDLCELLIAGSLIQKLTHESVCAEYIRFGGSARSVLRHFACKEYLKRFTATLQNTKDRAAVKFSMNSLLQVKDSSRFIFHLKVLNDDCTETIVVFASHYVEAELNKLQKVDDVSTMVEYVGRHLLLQTDEELLVGKTFELMVRKLFSSTGAGSLKYKARRLEPCASPMVEEVSLDLCGSFTEFHKLEQIQPGAKGYFVPDYRTYPCYDSLLVTTSEDMGVSDAFKVTINLCHDAKYTYIMELMEKLKLSRFYFVVPDRFFPSYPYQRLLFGKDDKDWPCELWVLAIPADFHNFHKTLQRVQCTPES